MQNTSEARPLVSVVVPVFKTQALLPRCLDSLLGQSLQEIEVICVDDASPDGCAAILAGYAARDARVRVVTHQKNEGLFRARISGIRAARGEYVAFVDSDDYVNLDCYRAALDAAAGADMTVLHTVHEDAAGSRYIHPRYAFYRFDDCAGDLFSRFFEQRGLCFTWHTVWNKVYRRALFERALPYLEALEGHLIMAEDLCFSAVLFYFARTISFSEYSWYFYYQHAGASTSLAGGFSKYVKNIDDLRRAFAFTEDFLHKVRASEKIFEDFVAWRGLYGRFWAENVKNGNLSGNELRALQPRLRAAFGERPSLPAPHESFFYGKTSPFDARYVQLSDYLCTLGEGDYVSFDIFDTLLVRPFYEPKDLFRLLDAPFAADFDCDVPFHVLRVKSEEIARQAALGEEVDIDAIYDAMADSFRLDRAALQKMQAMELRAELRFCEPRRSARNLFCLLRRRGAHILLISDIYLPRPFMEKLLARNGYTGYEKLFLSCESGATKRTGSLFRAAALACGVEPGRILHIGDNWESDVLRAEEAGVRTFFFARTVDCLLQRISDIPSTPMYRDFLHPSGTVNGSVALERLGVRCSLAVIANRLFDDPFRSYPAGSVFGHDAQFFGCAALGMHLLALTQWIRREGGEKVRFFARDGYLPLRAYRLLYGEEGTDYLHLSRRALLPLTLLLGGGTALFEANVPPGETPRSLCALLRPLLKPAFARRAAEGRFAEGRLAAGVRFEADRPFAGEGELRAFVSAAVLPNLSRGGCARYRAALKTYFSARLEEGTACFDVGYSGRTLYILAKLTGLPLRGLFVHEYGDAPHPLLAARGVSVKTFYEFAPSVAGHIRELLLSGVAPSCIGYAVGEGGAQPVFEPAYLHYAAAFTLRCVQEAALGFVADMRRTFGEDLEFLSLRPLEASAPLEYCLLYAAEEDRALFSPVAFEDRMYTGKEPSLLVDLWRRDVGFFLHNAPAQAPFAPPAPPAQAGPPAALHGQPRWKKAVYYWLFDRDTFRRKLRGEDKK